MLSRKHYEKIATIVRDAALINCATAGELLVNGQTRGRIAHELADYFAADNPRFDRDKFLTACGVA